MHAVHRALSISLGATLTLLCSAGTTSGAPAMLEPSIAHASFSMPRISAPIAGIKLLEDIFTRMHSLPQLAMSKMKPVVAFQQSPQQQLLSQQGPTDLTLAIKPKESRKLAKIAMAPQASSYGGEFLDDRKVREKDSGANATRALVKGTLIRVPESSQTVIAQDKADDRVFSPSRQRAQQADRDFLSRATNASGPATNSSPVTQNAKKSPQYKLAYGGSSVGGAAGGGGARSELQSLQINEEEHPGLAAMNKALGRMYNVTNQMQHAQSAGEAMIAQGYADSEGAKQLRAAMPNAKPMSAMAKRRSVQISESPRVTEYRADSQNRQISTNPMPEKAEPTDSDEFAAGATGSASSNGPSSPGSAPGAAYNMNWQKEGTYGYAAAGKTYTHEYNEIAGARGKIAEVAMNAPNVINGIPLVRLGAAASDAESALTVNYNIKLQHLEGWTVCTASKLNSRDTAAQLYIKHGMVEAMRIYDRALIPADLGVVLGDSVQNMKSRFGEPAFLIREPGLTERQSSMGQNYVYPISQVSFQLARSGKGAPQVVSVLIFNVK